MTKEEFEKGEDIAERRRWEEALRNPSSWRPLPTGFADRVIAAMSGERHVGPRPSIPTHFLGHRMRRMPRWALLAASLMLMAGFVFAAAVVVDAVIAKDGDGEAMVGCADPNAPEATDGSGAFVVPETGGTRSVASTAISDVPSVPSAASVPSTDLGNQQPTTDNQQPTTENQLNGGKAMNIKQKAALAAAAVTVAGVALPAAGVASATSGAMASFSSFVASRAQTASTLEDGFHSFVAQTIETDTLPQFNSRQPRGMRIVIQ